MPKKTKGWLVEEQARAELLTRFPARYEHTIAEHVTFKPDKAEMPQVDHCMLVGRADDGKGVEALVVALDGSTDRPDGLTWHITWSLAEDRRAKESNEVIAELGWDPIEGETRIPLVSGWWVWSDP